MRDKLLVFGAPQLTEADLQAVMDTFRSGWIGTGPQAHELEKQFSAYAGSYHAVALSSCTAALHLAMLALGIGPGDEVITTPMTFCATANAIIHAGATPVFADVDPHTGLIRPEEIEKRITSKTRAILPVHLTGRACDLDALVDLASAYHLELVEDCAHAIETMYHDRHAGTYGAAGCYSLYVTKNVSGIEGGLVLTNRSDIAEKVKMLALHGMTRDAWKRFSDSGYKHYEVVSVGFKNNLPDVHAALALSQLARVEQNLRIRDRIWEQYNQAFCDLPCWIPPADAANTRHARHLYSLLLDLSALTITRDQFLDELHRRNIGCSVHYISLHLHPYYRERFHFFPADFPQALWYSERTVSLPLTAWMTDQDTADVIEAVREILLRYKK